MVVIKVQLDPGSRST